MKRMMRMRMKKIKKENRGGEVKRMGEGVERMKMRNRRKKRLMKEIGEGNKMIRGGG